MHYKPGTTRLEVPFLHVGEHEWHLRGRFQSAPHMELSNGLIMHKSCGTPKKHSKYCWNIQKSRHYISGNILKRIFKRISESVQMNRFVEQICSNELDQLNQRQKRPLFMKQIGEIVHVGRGKNDNHRRKNRNPVDLSSFCGQRELCHSPAAELSMERSGMPQNVWDVTVFLKACQLTYSTPHTHTLAWFNPDSLLPCAKVYYIGTRLCEGGLRSG